MQTEVLLPSSTADFGAFLIRPMVAADVAAAGQIMFESFNTQNERLGLPPEWPSVLFTTSLINSLQNNPYFLSIVAVDKLTQEIIGSNFLEMGDTITAPGPISVSSRNQNSGVGRAMMDHVIHYSKSINKHNIRLVQVSNNLKSFALYASQGFEFGETLTMLGGRAAADTSYLKKLKQTYTLRPLSLQDVATCSLFHQEANSFSRYTDIAGAVHPASPHQPFVLLKDGQIRAYTTGFFLLGHTVAQTTEDFKVLFTLVSQLQESALFHLPSRVYPDLLSWSLNEAKLQVIRQEILMYQGHYEAPKQEIIYLPGMGY